MNSDNEQGISQTIQPLLGMPIVRAWNGISSFLIIEFGETIEFSPGNSRAEWYLWIYFAAWYLVNPTGEPVASEDPRELIGRHIRVLEGCKLLDVQVSSSSGETVFIFEHGIELHTFPLSFTDDSELWKLFTPANKVLCVYPGGKWTVRPADQSS